MRMSLSSRVYGFALVLCSVFALAGVGVVSPATAGAYATIAPQATFSSASGLPDRRVFEQVSPSNKDGNEAGGANISGGPPYIAGAPDGEGVVYFTSGPFGNTTSGIDFWTVSRRSTVGWTAYAAIPRGLKANGGNEALNAANPEQFFVSEDFSKVAYRNTRSETPLSNPPSLEGLFLHGLEDNSVAWLGEPVIPDPVPSLEQLAHRGEYPAVSDRILVGGSPDFSTVYFGYSGTLVPEDNVPDLSVGNVSRAQAVAEIGQRGFGETDLGFYEWRSGELRSAGILPDGSVDPNGAIPAAQIYSRFGNGYYHPNGLDNGVSEDGSRAFFVSPDPHREGEQCLRTSECARRPELYVHETAADGTQSSVLVSEDTLLPRVNGLPAPAPTGPLAVEQVGPVENEQRFNEGEDLSYIYASPDGSHVFFESIDQLTAEAPSNGSVKEYEFDLETNSLSYLPGVSPEGNGVAQILASSRDGSRFLFEKRVAGNVTTAAETPSSGYELDLWSNGQITPIMPLDETTVYPVKAALEGSAFVFVAPYIAGMNDAGGGQIVRYDVASNSLSCVSCPPVGVTPAGGGVLGSEDNANIQIGSIESVGTGDRAISDDGSRVFFQTSSALVPRDTNGVADVYEWENGTVFLISSGASPVPSFFGGTSATGDDVFFSTAEGLVPGDTDGGYDVYDARVPHPGDNPPPAAVPCEGSVCQGPPRVPAPLGAPASATFSGLGNIAPEPAAKPAAKPKPKATKCKKGFVKKKNKCVKKPKAKKAKKASNDRRAK